MKKELKHLNIALHNEDTSRYLFSDSNKSFNDWVITTAFYSAMHYLYYKVLPHKGTYADTELVLNSFDELFNAYRLEKPNYKESRHEFTKRWVNRNTNPMISAYYNALFDQCHNARYQGYLTDSRDAKAKLKMLSEIKKYCIS